MDLLDLRDWTEPLVSRCVSVLKTHVTTTQTEAFKKTYVAVGLFSHSEMTFVLFQGPPGSPGSPGKPGLVGAKVRSEPRQQVSEVLVERQQE